MYLISKNCRNSKLELKKMKSYLLKIRMVFGLKFKGAGAKTTAFLLHINIIIPREKFRHVPI